jgi:hypothetical protein
MALIKPDPVDPMKIRRFMALGAYAVLIVVIAFMLLFVIIGDKDMRDNLLSATGVLVLLLTCCTGLVVQYSSQAFRIQKKETQDVRRD